MKLQVQFLKMWADGHETVVHEAELKPGSAGQSFLVRPVPGTTALRIPILEGGECKAQFEIIPRGGVDWSDTVRFEVQLSPDGRLGLRAEGAQVLRLAAEAPPPPPPILLGPAPKQCNILLLIDATCRMLAAAQRGHQGWSAHVQAITHLFSALSAAYPGGIKVSVLAFGDAELSAVNGWRRATHLLVPDFRPFDSAELDRCIAELAPLAGPADDFVDALAESLRECSDAKWPATGRRLLVLSGDSPGHSILHPPPARADDHPRRFDVDHEAGVLCSAGVEIATLYHDEALASGALLPTARELARHAKEQYRRLASRPPFACLTSSWAPSAFAGELIRSRPPAMTRRPCLGHDLSAVLTS